MGIIRNTSPDQMREIKKQRRDASPYERQFLDELRTALEGKKIRFKHPVYGRVIDYWCPTENLAVCLDFGQAERSATFEELCKHRVPVIFVAPEYIRLNSTWVVREILALRSRARLLATLISVSKPPEERKQEAKAKNNKKVQGVPSAFMKPISTVLRPGREYYGLILPNGKGVLHSDWIKFRHQLSSHKRSPASAFDSKGEAESWIRSQERIGAGAKAGKKHETRKHLAEPSSRETLPKIELTDEYRRALEYLESSKRNVFITGKAGTGKSTLLHYFRVITKKKLAVLAPTGIAAVNVRGQTVHSFFQFPPRFLGPELYGDFKGQAVHKQLDALIIDEISMVRAEMMDAIDHFLQIFGPHPGKVFGGVQIICFGDPFQLPPVVKEDVRALFTGQIYRSPYFFSSKAFKMGDFVCLELSKVYRQQEGTFVSILNQVRTGTLNEEGLRLLNTRVLDPDPSDSEPVLVLSTHNATVDQINSDRLARLPGKESIYRAQVEGAAETRDMPVEEVIEVKVGAQVMMLRNHPEKGYYNGTMGCVTELGEDYIEVEIRKRSGKTKTVRVEAESFERIRHTVSGDTVKGKVVGSLKQIPVRLAWASTIHKAQGKTLDKVVLDLSRGAFEVGQTYVALSRCTSLEGLFLKQPISQEDILVDPIVEKFYQHYFGVPGPKGADKVPSAIG